MNYVRNYSSELSCSQELQELECSSGGFFFCSGYLAPFLMAGQEKCKLPVAIRGIVPLGGFLLMAPPRLTTPVGCGS